MKKLLSILLLMFLTLAPVSALNAEEDNSDSVTFFESTDNLANLDSYRMNQGIFGNFDMVTYSENIVGDFKVSILTDIYNNKAYESDSESGITGSVNLHAENETGQLESIIINFRARMKTVFNDGIYLRLDYLTFETNGLTGEEKEQYLAFKKEMESEIENYKNIWIYIPDNYYGDEINSNVPTEYNDLTDTDELMEDLKSKGLKEFYKDMMSEAIESMYASGTITDEQYDNFTGMTDEFFKTEFFTQSEINAGTNEGLTSFRLNKRKLMQFIENMAKTMGEEITATERMEMQYFFNKFSLFGLYSIDEVNRIFDSFKVRLVLRDIQQIAGMQLGYTYKISKINEIDEISEPDEFTSIKNINLSFLHQPMDDFYYDDTEWDFDSED